ncbi:MAG: T9SS type A sorting domain-containing protein [Bacteroidales bacterium]|nr:T9SS type A sorting domain-containing protein [Bacteroidales bacterium]
MKTKKIFFLQLILLILLTPLSLLGTGYYTTSWVGNSFGYGDGQWVQNHVNALYVAPDGSCFTQSVWDEGHNENSVYRDGRKLGKLGMGGGFAVGGNGDTVFCASGRNIMAFNAETRTRISSFLLTVGEDVKIYSIAARLGLIAVSDPVGNRILVYRVTNTKMPMLEIPVDRPADIAIDQSQTLWVVQSPNSYATYDDKDVLKFPAKILSFQLSSGEKTSREIHRDGWYPTAIAIDNTKNRLLVCDNSIQQQIYCFTNLDNEPTLDDTFFDGGAFGKKNGIYTTDKTKRGIVEDHSFYELAGVGMDKEGNLYLSLGGPAPRGDNPLIDTDLRKYDGETGELVWQLLGKEFVDMGDFDPDDNTRWMTKDTYYKLDWTKKEPGKEWTYVARNVDPFLYPHDPRAKILGAAGSHTSAGENIFLRRVADDQNNRHLLMFGAGMAGVQLPRVVWRFDKNEAGEMAIPAVVLSKWGEEHNVNNWPFNGKFEANKEWLWVDANGDGQMQTDEYELNTEGPEGGNEYPFFGSAHVDADGGMWTAYRERGIRCLECKGYNEYGVPLYSFSPRVYYSMPEDMTDVHLLRYVGGDEDIMYLAGFTKTNDNTTGSDQPSLVQNIVKYKNWKSAPVKLWETSAEEHAYLKRGASFEVEGDYIFVGNAGQDGTPSDPRFQNGTVWIYSAETGEYVTSLSPGPEVGYGCGWMDIWDSSLRARKISDDEYIIVVEDDWHSKSIIYRWYPAQESPYIQPESLTLSPNPLNLVVNQSQKIETIFEPEDCSSKAVYFTSSSNGIVLVDEDGWLHAVGVGRAEIEAIHVTSGIRAKARVTVKEDINAIDNVEENVPVHIYPTVISDIFTVDLKDDQTYPTQISIIDLSGKVVKRITVTDSQTVEISMGGLEKGIYIVFVQNEDRGFSQKIIKE